MHYWWPAVTLPNCQQTGSNYSQAGLTACDRLAVHIMYPEDVRTVEFYGDPVIRTGDTLQLVSAWQVRGANMSFVAGNWQWWVDGVLRSSASSLSVGGLGAGIYPLSISHDDFLGRHYVFTGNVRVLSPLAYNQLAAATNASQLVLAPEITLINLPYVIK